VEVVLALGIASFSLIGILSVFPVALDTAKDSKNETRIALMAQSIFSDLQCSTPASADVIVKSATRLTEGLSLTFGGTVYVAYDADGQAIGQLTSGDMSNFSTSNPSLRNASFLASISASTTGMPVGLARVDVSIQTPPKAAATVAARKKYLFSAYILN